MNKFFLLVLLIQAAAFINHAGAVELPQNVIDCLEQFKPVIKSYMECVKEASTKHSFSQAQMYKSCGKVEAKLEARAKEVNCGPATLAAANLSSDQEEEVQRIVMGWAYEFGARRK